MKYIEEIMARVALTPVEIGVLVFVRDVMRNNCVVAGDVLRESIGPDWRMTVGHLKSLGVLTIHRINPTTYRIQIAAPGDKKRTSSRNAARQKRLTQKGDQ